MQKREIAGNTDTGLLKIIAIVCMIVDHAGVRIFPDVQELRIIGRIAFPLYLWCMVVGACYTRAPIKYALRLLIAGIVSQPFYMLGLNHRWDQLNIMFTLLLGYIGIVGIRENRCGSRYWAPLLALLTTEIFTVDYGLNGVLLAMLLYLVREKRGAVAALMATFCMYWGTTSSSITEIAGYSLQRNGQLLNELLNWSFFKRFLRLQALAVLSLPLMLWRKKERTPFPKWAAYAAYPGHLLILWLVQLAMHKTTLGAAKVLLFPFM